jgi:hypothetical protein
LTDILGDGNPKCRAKSLSISLYERERCGVAPYEREILIFPFEKDPPSSPP